ncbi:hypothetical protein ACCE85_003693 [Photobacterium damselae]
MKGFHFVECDCKDAAFWLTSSGSISRKYHPSLIGCQVTDPKSDVELLIRMILITKPKKGGYTAEYLNSIC